MYHSRNGELAFQRDLWADVLHFLTACLSHLGLLWQRVGCSSYEQWLEQFPMQVAYARRCICIAIGLVEKRFVRKFMRPPWIYFGLGDCRRHEGDYADIADQIRETRSCCQPYGMARDLHEMRLSQELLTSWRFRRVLFFGAYGLMLSMALIERLHARSRRSSNPQTPWSNFAANFVNAEHKEQRGNRDRVSEAHRPIYGYDRISDKCVRKWFRTAFHMSGRRA